MTAAGWFLMLATCGSVTALLVFCYWRLLSSPAPDRHRESERHD